MVLTLRAASPEEARFWVGSLLWLGRLSSKRPQLPLREVSAVDSPERRPQEEEMVGGTL